MGHRAPETCSYPPPPTPGTEVETICSLCRLGTCKGGLSKGGGSQDIGGARAAKAWLAQETNAV